MTFELVLDSDIVLSILTTTKIFIGSLCLCYLVPSIARSVMLFHNAKQVEATHKARGETL